MALVASMVLLLLVSGYLNAVAHFFFVKHERCDEHGQLVHSGHHSHAPAGEHVQHEGPNSRLGLGIRSSDFAEHEHEHCGVSLVSGTHVAPSEAIAIARDGFSTWLRWAHDAPDLGCRTEDVCAFAPKTSPPLAG
jgi:hypothetical protein